MKMYVSVKCTNDDGSALKEGSFPQEIACQPMLEPGMNDFEKTQLMLKAFSEITLQVMLKIFYEAEEMHEAEIKRHETPRKLKTVVSLPKPIKRTNKDDKKV